jgi:DNA polymerase III subunit delta'
LRGEAEELARAAVTPGGGAPWQALLEGAESAGSEAERQARDRLAEEESGRRLSAREAGEEARRVGRRRRTEVLDLGLELCAAWLRDLGAVAAGAAGVVLNSDRTDELAREAEGLDPTAARRGVELVQDTRRRLDLNVSEELALEALSFRLARVTGPAA